MQRQRIVLWRHGQTDWNIANRFQGHSDIALNEVGIRQAERAAPLLLNLEPSRIISSDLIRARKTAEALAKLSGLEVQIDSDLRETNGGNWEGKTGEQNRAEDYHRFVHWLDGDDERAGEVGEKRSEIASCNSWWNSSLHFRKDVRYADEAMVITWWIIKCFMVDIRKWPSSPRLGFSRT